jgi:hypothetical protein
VDLKDILAGEVEIDLRPLLDSLQAIGEEAQEEPGPTTRGRSRPARTPTTGTAT